MGRYLIKECKTGFTFNLESGNRQVIGVSEVYATKALAQKGCKSVETAATKAQIEDKTAQKPVEQKNPKFEIYLDKKGEFRFRLIASNGEIVLASEGYTAKPNCKNGIKSVIKNCTSEIVFEGDLKKAEEEKKAKAAEKKAAAKKPAAKTAAKKPAAKPAAKTATKKPAAKKAPAKKA